MTKHVLKAQKRTISGRKVKLLRREGILPASIYGKDVESELLQVDLKEFRKIENEVGESGLVYVQIDSEERPVLITNVQVHPVTGLPIHADFHQVNLKEAIKAMVPVQVVGESLGVAEGKGILIQPLSEVEVEALPADLPEKFEIDVTSLAEVDQAIFVKDLKVDSKVKILTNLEEIIAKITPLAKEEIVEAPTVIEGEAASVSTEATPPETPTPESIPEKTE